MRGEISKTNKKTRKQLDRLFKHQVFQHYSISRKVLVSLLETAGDLYFGNFVRLMGWDNKKDTQNFRSSLNYLKNKGLIERTSPGEGKSLFELTADGKKEAQKLQIKIKYHKAKWDGRWRFVVFDIPEDRRKLRDGLRGTLKYLGFIKLQGSVWVFPHDVFDDLEELVPDIKKHHWIKLIESDRVVNDKDIYKEFFSKVNF